MNLIGHCAERLAMGKVKIQVVEAVEIVMCCNTKLNRKKPNFQSGYLFP
jgi:hypothetical protein